MLGTARGEAKPFLKIISEGCGISSSHKDKFYAIDKEIERKKRRILMRHWSLCYYSNNHKFKNFFTLAIHFFEEKNFLKWNENIQMIKQWWRMNSIPKMFWSYSCLNGIIYALPLAQSLAPLSVKS